jgi:uncharacterized protein YkwD
MFQFMRSRAKVFYWVIAVTFLLFMAFSGSKMRGCDGAGGGNLEAGVVGSVNGTKITAAAYDQAYRQQVAMMKQQAPDRELNANQYAAAQEGAWDFAVQTALIDQAIAKRKIRITDQEVLDAFRTNPPAELLAQYRTESGSVDMQRYYADLQNPAINWKPAEDYVRQILPRQKLSEQIAAAVAVSDDEVRREYLRQVGRAMAEYVGVAFTDINDGYNPTDQEITDWYAAHAEDYKHDGLATCKVVRFAKNPSAADEKDIVDTLNSIRQEIQAGTTDFATAAKQYSDDTGSGERGGDIGSFDRSRMVPEFANPAFALPIGQISEPVRTQFGYHLIEVTAQTKDAAGQVTQVTARHILMKVTPGPQTLDTINAAATGFRDRVNATNFVSTAEAEALEVLKPAAVARGRDIPGLALSLVGTNWVFTAKPGTVGPVMENDDCYFVILAERIDPAGTRSLDDVRSQVMLALRKQHNTLVAKQRLAPALSAVQAGTALSQVARTYNLKYAVSDTFSYNSNVADVGYGTDFNKTVLEGLVGRVTEPVETMRGVYAAVPLWIKPVNETEFAASRVGIQQALMSSAQNEAIDKWLKEEKAKAKIVDHRAEMRAQN